MLFFIISENIFYYDRISIFCVIIYYSAFIIIPTYLIRQTNQPVASSLALLLEQVRFLMKIHAYIRSNVPIIINFKPKTEDFTFPNFNNYFYFLFAPTLVYRDEYPREKKRNWKNIITLTVEFVLTLFYLAFVMERFFLTPFQDWCLKERKWSDLFSQIMINMIPALLVKLCGFFMFLHIWLNLFAEILRFGDREFYKVNIVFLIFEDYFLNFVLFFRIGGIQTLLLCIIKRGIQWYMIGFTHTYTKICMNM